MSAPDRHIAMHFVYDDWTDAVCDFCTEPARVVYPAKPVAAPLANVHGQVAHTVTFSRADWSACEQCRVLIDSGRRVELSDRAVSAFLARPDVTAALAKLTRSRRRSAIREVRDSIRRLHDDFWAARLGTARPLKARPRRGC